MPAQNKILDLIMERAHIGFATLNTEGRFVDVSPSYMAMIGLSETELQGQHWRKFIHPDDHVRTHATFELARSHGEGAVEIRTLCADSTIARYSLTITGVKDEHGVFSGYYCLQHDISSYKQGQTGLMPSADAAAGAIGQAAGASIDARHGHFTQTVEEDDPVEIPEAIMARRPVFLANRQIDVAKMRDALAARDFATIQVIGHNCKGTGAGYGFPEISTYGASIESLARALNVENLGESISQFESCIMAAAVTPGRSRK